MRGEENWQLSYIFLFPCERLLPLGEGKTWQTHYVVTNKRGFDGTKRGKVHSLRNQRQFEGEKDIFWDSLSVSKRWAIHFLSKNSPFDLEISLLSTAFCSFFSLSGDHPKRGSGEKKKEIALLFQCHCPAT